MRSGEKATAGGLLDRSSLHVRVVDALRRMIVTGELAPGERIVESDLAERLGVSRTPMREAIKTLVLDGLVDSPIHRGARVKPLELSEVDALFEVIAIVEALAAEQATRRIDPADLTDLLALHDRMHDFYEQGDRETYFELNTTIHERIVALAGNPILSDVHARLMLRARRGRYLAIFSADRWRQAVAEHDALMAAMRDGDAEKAFDVWRAHLMNTGEAVRQSISAQPAMR